MIFKLLIVIMSLLIYDSSPLHVPKDRLPSPWGLYRYDVIKALGPKRDEDDDDDSDKIKHCLDSPIECPDRPTDQIFDDSEKEKKAYNKINYIDIWGMLARHSKTKPVILVEDLENIPKNKLY